MLGLGAQGTGELGVNPMRGQQSALVVIDAPNDLHGQWQTMGPMPPGNGNTRPMHQGPHLVHPRVHRVFLTQGLLAG